MLWYSPILKEDELLFGWMTRYHAHAGNKNPKWTTKELFESYLAHVQPDLPLHLCALYRRMEWFSPPPLEELAYCHTLLGYYSFFLDEKKKQDTFTRMVEVDGKRLNLHSTLGINRSVVTRWSFLRYCPHCWEADRETHGERYWRVSHQLPKVFYCPTHQLPLLDSSIQYENKRLYEYVSAEEIDVPESLPHAPLFHPKTETVLKWLAVESKRLLMNRISLADDDLSRIYRYLLYTKGYVEARGWIDYPNLMRDFTDFFGEECLEVLESEVDETDRACWMKLMMRQHKRSFHPVRHLLLLRFLGVTFEQLERMKGKEAEPFGSAPYLCLNPAADHYRQRVVSELSIRKSADGDGVNGRFTCACGFSYSRKGPDVNEADQLRIGNINCFGSVWEAKLLHFLQNEGLSYAEAAKRLGTSACTARKYDNSFGQKEESEHDILRTEKEAEWLRHIEENQGERIQVLRELNRHLYAWHYRHNREWILQNPLREKKRGKNKSKVNWEERDREMAEELRQVAREMCQEEKPVFLSRHGLSQRMKHPRKLLLHLNKLPQTAEVLEVEVETRDEFRIRRIYWACKEILKQDKTVASWRIRGMTGMQSLQSQMVERALKEAIAEYNGRNLI